MDTKLDRLSGTGEPQCRCSHQGNVLVLAEHADDQSALCGLLSDVGYRPMVERGLCSIAADAHRRLELERVVATVVCHRRHAFDHGAGACRNRPSRLPALLRAKRVIAVCDCAAEGTVVSLLHEGADQCFYLHESPVVLRERLNAALRLHGHRRHRQLQLGDICFDLDKRRVTRAGKPVDLAPKEFQLAYYLFSNHTRIIDNKELMTSIWSLPLSMDTRRIDTAACRVRKKLMLVQGKGWWLKRIRGVGYRMIPPET